MPSAQLLAFGLSVSLVELQLRSPVLLVLRRILAAMKNSKGAAPSSASMLAKVVKAGLHGHNVVKVKTVPLTHRGSKAWLRKSADESAGKDKSSGKDKLTNKDKSADKAPALTQSSSPLKSNVFNTALLFEGGSMRAAYTSAVATYLLEQGVYFNQVYGVSAGSSNLVNYLSRDKWRTSCSFTEFMDDSRTGNMGTFLRGKGAFNAEYIYQQAGKPEGILPFDFGTFAQNPAHCCVFSIDRDTGEDIYFTDADMTSLDRLTVMVRASSTLPMFMPAPVIDGHVCYDGGFAVGGGLPLKKIEADGFDRVVVVRTRKRGYRKDDHNEWARAFFKDFPEMRKAALTRSERYNEACDLLDEWEKQGRAYVFYCDDLTLSGTERDVNLLKVNFQAGYDQIRRDWDGLMSYVQKWG